MSLSKVKLRKGCGPDKGLGRRGCLWGGGRWGRDLDPGRLTMHKTTEITERLGQHWGCGDTEPSSRSCPWKHSGGGGGCGESSDSFGFP